MPCIKASALVIHQQDTNRKERCGEIPCLSSRVQSRKVALAPGNLYPYDMTLLLGGNYIKARALSSKSF